MSQGVKLLPNHKLQTSSYPDATKITEERNEIPVARKNMKWNGPRLSRSIRLGDVANG